MALKTFLISYSFQFLSPYQRSLTTRSWLTTLNFSFLRLPYERIQLHFQIEIWSQLPIIHLTLSLIKLVASTNPFQNQELLFLGKWPPLEKGLYTFSGQNGHMIATPDIQGEPTTIWNYSYYDPYGGHYLLGNPTSNEESQQQYETIVSTVIHMESTPLFNGQSNTTAKAKYFYPWPLHAKAQQ